MRVHPHLKKEANKEVLVELISWFSSDGVHSKPPVHMCCFWREAAPLLFLPLLCQTSCLKQKGLCSTNSFTHRTPCSKQNGLRLQDPHLS